MYYWVNFINLICYKVNKTIEFRLLRPTYNFNKIKLWLYIFNAILMYAEDINAPIPRTVRLKSVLTKVYPDSILDYLLTGVQKLKILSTKIPDCVIWNLTKKQILNSIENFADLILSIINIPFGAGASVTE